MMVTNDSPEEKLQVITGLGALLTTVSVVICTLCDKDPWGRSKGCVIIFSHTAVFMLHPRGNKVKHYAPCTSHAHVRVAMFIN